MISKGKLKKCQIVFVFCFHFILIESNERKYFLFYPIGHENEQIKYKNLFVSIYIKSGHNIDTTSAETTGIMYIHFSSCSTLRKWFLLASCFQIHDD